MKRWPPNRGDERDFSPGSSGRIPHNNTLLRKRSRELGESFAAEVAAAITVIRTAPRTRAANLRGTRRRLLRRFPYTIHYKIEQASVLGAKEIAMIYAVRHVRRDPENWLDRLPPPSTK